MSAPNHIEREPLAAALQLDQLFRLFLGSADAAEDKVVSPASPALRARLMVIFNKSLQAANRFPATMQVQQCQLPTGCGSSWHAVLTSARGIDPPF